MPRFPVAFGRRKSAADSLENVPAAEPSFRVLERAEVVNGKSFDGGARLAARTHHLPQTSVSGISIEDNIFADLKTNRGSGSSNTTKTTSTDTSSRHSNASTAPSSADVSGQEDWRNANKKSQGEVPPPPLPKSGNSGFLRAAGRTFSFGGQKKQLPPVPAAEEPLPETPPLFESGQASGRSRATTASTATTVTPPKIDADINLDLGGDFSKLFLGFDKRASVATIREDPSGRQASAPRVLAGNRANQPSPIQIDRATKVEAPLNSWNSQNSNDRLVTASPVLMSPQPTQPSIPRRSSPLSGLRQKTAPGTEASLKRSSAIFGRKTFTAENAEPEDEEAMLLKDSLSAVSKFMAGGAAASMAPSGRSRKNEDTFGPSSRQAQPESRTSRFDSKIDEENLFESSLAQSSNLARRYVSRQPSPPRNKVMTPAQFERYREDKTRQDSRSNTPKPVQANDDEEEDHYEDEEDDAEKAKQLAKQRRKQEAHMTVYRQQMMKVTGEAANLSSSRPSLQLSFSTPNLGNIVPPGPAANASDGSDEDEEVPLAILAAHGFPNKNRPPTRLSTMMSNPNLRASTQPSYQRPGSVVGDPSGSGSGARLPAFARNLPKDPFVGAGLVHNPVRESFALGGGVPASATAGGASGQPQGSSIPPGGLIGVIANEERSRAMRRGSPQIDGQIPTPPMGTPGFDPVHGIPPQMMYPMAQQMQNSMMLSPGDQAQIQMTQQMQQFMQMQMQFMQMMASQTANGSIRPNGHVAAHSTGSLNVPGVGSGGMLNDLGAPDMMARHSFVGNGSMLDLPRGDNHLRTMSMVQPSSSSWIQPPPLPNGYAPSVRAQGAGYAPSIAPSERSNVGLPGRYRPVSQVPPLPLDHTKRSSTMPGALGGWGDVVKPAKAAPALGKKSDSAEEEDDEEEGWEAMKAKRDKKKSLWRTKKSFGADIEAMIS